MRRLVLAGGLGVAVALAVLGAALPRLAAHADGAVMRVSPPSQNVDSGAQSVTVNITIEGAANVGAYEFAVKYNADVLELVDATDGGFMSARLPNVQCYRGPAENFAADVVDFGCGVIGTQPAGADGGGVLGIVTFRPKKTGASDVVFVKRELADPLGAAEFVDTADGIVNIVPPGSTPAPLQPTPTANPVLLTPTAVPERQQDPFILRGSRSSPSSRSDGSSGSGNGTSGGASNGTSGGGSSGSRVQLPPGSSSGVAGSRSADNANFPTAGTGPEQHSNDGWVFGAAALFAAGAMLTTLGVRRKDAGRHEPHRKDDVWG